MEEIKNDSLLGFRDGKMKYDINADDITIFILEDLVFANSRSMRNKIHDVINNYPDKKVILDLTECYYMDSSGLGVMISVYRIKGDRKDQVILRNLSIPVKTMMDVASVLEFFTII